MASSLAEPATTTSTFILIVEDHDDTRAVYEAYFRAVGYEVEGASDGNEGIKLALARRPDAIVMDLTMPGLDGWEAIRLLRAYGSTRLVPIVALSGRDDPVSQVRAYAAGCDAFVAKPCTPEHLYERVRRFFHPAGP
jgi:CheY-like chemotaxis protein